MVDAKKADFKCVLTLSKVQNIGKFTKKYHDFKLFQFISLKRIFLSSLARIDFRKDFVFFNLEQNLKKKCKMN